MILENVRSSGRVEVLKNAIPNTPDVEFFREHRKVAMSHIRSKWITDTLSMAWEEDGCPELTKHEGFKTFRNELLAFFGDTLWDSPAAILSDVTGELSGFNFHVDNGEQAHWQCAGKSSWYFKYPDGTEENYELEAGDVIYIPWGIGHSVTSLESPRAGIVFSAFDMRYSS